jgi:hypothetical protein
MAQFPVSSSQGVIDGLNYVLSGPSGTGQNFAGFSNYLPWDLTGNYRAPFTLENFNSPGIPNINLYVAPISLGVSEMLDERTWKFNFATTQPTAPFILGQPVFVTGVTDSYYDGFYSPIGVIACTDTYVIVRSQNSFPVVANSSGGTVELNSMDSLLSTDCNGRITVTSATDRVFISAQVNAEIFTDATVGNFTYSAQISRYRAFTNPDPVNPDFRFELDEIVAFKSKLVTNAPPLSVTEETIFTSIQDTPVPGYYWYILELTFGTGSGPVIVTNVILNQRSFSAQLVKQ